MTNQETKQGAETVGPESDELHQPQPFQLIVAIKELAAYLNGKKTYLFGVLLAFYVLLTSFGAINATPEQAQAVEMFLLALMGLSLRSGVKKVNDDLKGFMGNYGNDGR